MIDYANIEIYSQDLSKRGITIKERITGGKSSACFKASKKFGDYEGEVFVKVLEPKINDSPTTLMNILLGEVDNQEVQALLQIKDPHLVSLIDVFNEEKNIQYEGQDAKINRTYIVMEYINGTSLDEVLKREGTKNKDKKKIEKIINSLLEAVYSLHNKKLVHRDIKPGNILIYNGLLSDAETLSLKLGDLQNSLSEERYKELKLDERIDEILLRRGATSYTSPSLINKILNMEKEVRFNELIRSDIYAIGATIYALITGKELNLFNLVYQGDKKGKFRINKELYIEFDKEKLKNPLISKALKELEKKGKIELINNDKKQGVKIKVSLVSDYDIFNNKGIDPEKYIDIINEKIDEAIYSENKGIVKKALSKAGIPLNNYDYLEKVLRKSLSFNPEYNSIKEIIKDINNEKKRYSIVSQILKGVKTATTIWAPISVLLLSLALHEVNISNLSTLKNKDNREKVQRYIDNLNKEVDKKIREESIKDLEKEVGNYEVKPLISNANNLSQYSINMLMLNWLKDSIEPYLRRETGIDTITNPYERIELEREIKWITSRIKEIDLKSINSTYDILYEGNGSKTDSSLIALTYIFAEVPLLTFDKDKITKRIKSFIPTIEIKQNYSIAYGKVHTPTDRYITDIKGIIYNLPPVRGMEKNNKLRLVKAIEKLYLRLLASFE